MARLLATACAAMIAVSACAGAEPQSREASSTNTPAASDPAGAPTLVPSSPSEAPQPLSPQPEPPSETETPERAPGTGTQPGADARSFTVLMAGDVLLHDGLWVQAEIDAQMTGEPEQDYRPMLESMRPVIAGADLAICHMETPIAESAADAEGYPLFNAPPQIVRALGWAGFDVCTTASNHTLDQHFSGTVRTLDALDAGGIGNTGSYRTEADSRRPYIRDVAGVPVAILSYTYGTNGIPLPADQPWAVNLLETSDPQAAADRILTDARAARGAGAEVVLVAYHWGQEYATEPSGDQDAVAELVLATPEVDVLYGHHAHVVQPIDVIDGRWVVYGLGNMIANQSPVSDGRRDGLTVQFTLTEQPGGGFAVTLAEYVPTFTTEDEVSGDIRYLDIVAALGDDGLDGTTRGVLEAALDRIESDVNLFGAREDHGLRRSSGATD